jgi:peptidoglycan/xylan/chitin deacetylase (PgdA/CDA1 family)
MKRFFSKYIWRFSLDTKEIYLSFEDVPTTEITEFVLDELKKYNAKATFLGIGKNKKKHAKIFKKILVEGHAVGNHTQQHLNGWKTETERYVDTILESGHTLLTSLDKTQEPKSKSQNCFVPLMERSSIHKQKNYLKKATE